MKKLIGTTTMDFGNFYVGDKIYLDKHEWDCGWYWGFGYIGNKDLHCHFNDTFLKSTDIFPSTHFKSNLTDNQWWIVRDLFVQAYALKKCAEVYRYGGHQTTAQGTTDLIRDDEMCTRLNSDLRIILDKIWELIQENC